MSRGVVAHRHTPSTHGCFGGHRLVDLGWPREQEFAGIKAQPLQISRGIVELDGDGMTQTNPGEDVALCITELELVEAQGVHISRARSQALGDREMDPLSLDR